MDYKALFERDLLYPTENLYEPGSVHVEVLSPNKKARIPVIIEGKTSHSPLKYIDSILRIMQSDIFDRIFVDIKKNTDLYIKASRDLVEEAGSKRYIAVIFNNEGVEYKGTDKIE